MESWTALRMVRQPILIAVDSHEILEATGDSRLLVRLHLGHIDKKVAGDRCSRYQVLLDFPAMMAIGHC